MWIYRISYFLAQRVLLRLFFIVKDDFPNEEQHISPCYSIILYVYQMYQFYIKQIISL